MFFLWDEGLVCSGGEGWASKEEEAKWKNKEKYRSIKWQYYKIEYTKSQHSHKILPARLRLHLSVRSKANKPVQCSEYKKGSGDQILWLGKIDYKILISEMQTNAVIQVGSDLQFWFGPLVLLSELFLSCAISCVVFSVPDLKAQFRRVHIPSAVGTLSSKACWVWLLEIPVEHLHCTMSHESLLCCSVTNLVLAWRKPVDK